MGERYPVLLSCTMGMRNLRIYILCGSLSLLTILLEYTLQTAVACTRPVRGSVKRIVGRVEARAPGDWPCPVALGMLQTRPTSIQLVPCSMAVTHSTHTGTLLSCTHTHTHTHAHPGTPQSTIHALLVRELRDSRGAVPRTPALTMLHGPDARQHSGLGQSSNHHSTQVSSFST